MRPKATDTKIPYPKTKAELLKFYLQPAARGKLRYQYLARDRWIELVFDCRNDVDETLWEKAFNTISQ